MLVFKTAHELRSCFKSNTQTLGLVPTMGALHEGHLSLVKKACEENDTVVVSIYINPTQFNEIADLERYPSDLEKDKALLEPFSNQLILYAPDHKELYPEGIQSKTYDFGSLATHMEGSFREGHFDGVATVVETLLRKIQPQKAYFGEKDFQQLQVVKALTTQKKLGITIVSCPIVREKDGLAMSSRNRLLTPEQRKAAPRIFASLCELKKKNFGKEVPAMEAFFKKEIARQKELKVEYFFVASPSDLIPVSTLEEGIDYRIFVAVFAGKTRLIDTVQLGRI
jgi:pantoate--beta-alanine ligase